MAPVFEVDLCVLATAVVASLEDAPTIDREADATTVAYARR